MEENKVKEKEKDNAKKRIINIIVIIIIIIIIILLLLHNCGVVFKDDENPLTGDDVIDICDGKDCNKKIDCLKDYKNKACIIPDFRGMTEKEVKEWLSKIENKIEVKYVEEYSEDIYGIIFDQSEEGITIKDLLENNKKLIIKISNNENKKIDCLTDYNNRLCIIPDFKGMTEEEVKEWLDKIKTDIDIRYEVKDYEEKTGTIIDQSEKGITVKDLVEENKELVIVFSNSKNQQVNCLEEPQNEICEIPDFKGMTKKEVLDWLDKVTNDLKVEFNTEKSNSNNGTVIKQSNEKTTIKDLIDNNETLIITFANNEKVNCLTDETNPICIVPNFTGSTKKEVENWLNSIDNLVSAKYENKKSGNTEGTITNQSVKKGTTVKDLLKNNEVLVITLAKKELTEEEKEKIRQEEEKKNIADGLTANDKKVKWSTTTKVKIFENSKFNNEEVIAPESSGTYKFEVNNGTKYKMKYNLTFIETNNYNINLKYKLKKNNEYIVDHYVSINEINKKNIIINSKRKDTYYLEWKWVSSDNDTEIGTNPNATYKLNIKVEAESVQ